MASAKFLEEALSTDVDESAVSAIVGSLETQLVAVPKPPQQQSQQPSSVSQTPPPPSQQQPAVVVQPPAGVSPSPSQAPLQQQSSQSASVSSTSSPVTAAPTPPPPAYSQQSSQSNSSVQQLQSTGTPVTSTTAAVATVAVVPAAAPPSLVTTTTTVQLQQPLPVVFKSEPPQAPPRTQPQSQQQLPLVRKTEFQAQSQIQQQQLPIKIELQTSTRAQHVANGSLGPETSSENRSESCVSSSTSSSNVTQPQLPQMVNSVVAPTTVAAVPAVPEQPAQLIPKTPTSTVMAAPVTLVTSSSAPPGLQFVSAQQIQAMQQTTVQAAHTVVTQSQSQPQVQAQQHQQTHPQPQSQQQQQQQQQHQQQQQQQQSQQQQFVISNQITSSHNIVQQHQQQLTTLAKIGGEHVKIVYPGTGQVITGGLTVNANNKLTFPAQLANGALGVVSTKQGVQLLQGTPSSSSTSSSSVISSTQSTATNQPQVQQQTIGVNKQTALVIKTSVPGGMVSVPMPATVAASMANAAAQQQAGKPTGVSSGTTLVPGNVQILNVNAMRSGTPVTGQQATKPVNRVVIAQGHQQLMAGRTGAPGITLQALQSIQAAPGQQLLLKTDSGQYRLVTLAPSASQIGNNINAANTSTAVAVASPGASGTTTFRLATMPAVSRLNAQFTGPPLATIRKPIQTVAPTVTTTTVTPVTSTIVAATTTAPTPAATTAQPSPAPAQRQATDNNTKEKCRKFLANLLELSSREPRHVERNVRTLIQELIDSKVEPEMFCERLEKLLNASPQPCLIGFLKKSLPLLRQSLISKELTIEGIRPPPSSTAVPVGQAIAQNQIRPTVAVAPGVATGMPTATQVVASSANVAVSPAIGSQVRVVAPLTGVTNIPRPPQPMVQHRLVRPAATIVRQPTTTFIKSPVIQQAGTQALQQQQISQLHPQQMAQQQQQQMTIHTTNTNQLLTNATRQTGGPIIQKSATSITPATKTTSNQIQNKNNANTTQNKATVPSTQPKPPVTKEKEKKTFSSAGYTGDDDINDVAAMGGVNLAEESQRILGSTKFVGTQIRSCKDEVFLHMTPLQQKINKIVTSHGLEEPNQEVASLISHAAQERLKNLVEKLAVIAEHRIDLNKVDPRYEVTQDVRSQLKFLEELDKLERKRHEEHEREALLKAAKSRAKTEDPEQAKLKAKAKEMQRVEMEEARQREANQTALQAIGPRKKPKLDLGAASGNTTSGISGLGTGSTGFNRQLPLRPRLKRVNFRDLLFLLEQEKETRRSVALYKSYLK